MFLSVGQAHIGMCVWDVQQGRRGVVQRIYKDSLGKETLLLQSVRDEQEQWAALTVQCIAIRQTEEQSA